MRILWCFVFVSAIGSSLQRSTPSDDSYVAAVLEYAFTSNYTVNLENYLQNIRDAAAQGADIVVFPELTLRSDAAEVPINGSLRQYSVPALNPELYAPVLVALSAAAAEHQIYVVVDLEEICDCTKNDQGENCPEAKIYYFNTNVVFDRNGAIIDRYRKINLFGEFSRTPALTPDLGIFTTDFGVTFGHFICFDLMFQVPSVQVVEKHGIKDIIFTTMWFSEMPYLTAVQIQEGYAYTLNVNMLASGANNVQRGSAGSGIYSGRAGALISTMPGVPATRLLVHRVPKEPGNITDISGPIVDSPEEADGLFLKVDPSLRAHLTRLLVPGSQEFTLTDGEVSCRFRVRLNHRISETSPKFRAFAHDGSNTYVRRTLGVVGCSVVACKDEQVGHCGYKYKQQVGIEEIEIHMTSYKTHLNTSLGCNDVVYYPSSFQNNNFPLSPKNFTLYSDLKNGRSDLVMKLEEPQENLVSFGIYGRIFTKDVNSVGVVSEEEISNYIELEDLIFTTSHKD